MSYIGNQPLYQQFLVDTFSGNGSTLAFTMTVAPANAASVLIAITGVIQDPSSYAVNGTTLTFFTAPPTGTNNISVRYLGLASIASVGANVTTQGLYEMANTISANYSISSGNNAMSAGPITVNSGVSVTVPTGSVWTIV